MMFDLFVFIGYSIGCVTVGMWVANWNRGK